MRRRSMKPSDHSPAPGKACCTPLRDAEPPGVAGRTRAATTPKVNERDREGAVPATPAQNEPRTDGLFVRVFSGPTGGMRLIPGAEFLMGTDGGYGFAA